MDTERAKTRSRQQTRRRFLAVLGWTIVLLASSLFVVLIRFIVHPRLDASKGFLANLLDAVRTRIRRRQPIAHDSAKRKRLARRAIKPFVSPELVVNPKSNIVHWPNPAVYVCRTRFANTVPIPFANWFQTVSSRVAACAARHLRNGEKRLPPSAQTKPRFEKNKEGRVREFLALRALQTGASATIGNVDRALEILLPAVDSPYHQCDWRLRELYGRLVCLAHPSDAHASQEQIRKDLHPDASLRAKQRMPWLYDNAAFLRWHAKTNQSSYFQARLKRRMKQARGLDVLRSSSGKDTRQPGKGRPNRPRMTQPTREGRSTSPKHRVQRCPPPCPAAVPKSKGSSLRRRLR
jgi:hypothetical protein